MIFQMEGANLLFGEISRNKTILLRERNSYTARTAEPFWPCPGRGRVRRRGGEEGEGRIPLSWVGDGEEREGTPVLVWGTTPLRSPPPWTDTHL